MGIGSCNAERWRAHRTAGILAGVSISSQNRIEQHMREDDTGVSMRQMRAGDVWAWEYQTNQPSPVVWCGLDSSGLLAMVWEAEEPFDAIWQDSNPIYTVNAVGKDALPGGQYVKALILDDSILSTLQDEIDAAAQPAWIAGSAYEGCFDETTYLHAQLFFDGQARDGNRFGMYREYEDFMERSDIGWITKNYLTILWLRAASQVLMDHAIPSLIPLAMDRWTVNGHGEISI